MKRIVCIIFISIMLITGCSYENIKIDNENKNEEQSVENTLENTEDDIKHMFDNKLLDSLKNSEDDVILIKDKLFIAQTNDIYLNPEEYMDKTIKWEGIYTEITNPETNEIYRFVIRNGPGCCGYDGTAGFEVLYEGELPNKDDWVEAVGKIEMVEEEGQEFLAIRLSELIVLDARGEETVIN